MSLRNKARLSIAAVIVASAAGDMDSLVQGVKILGKFTKLNKRDSIQLFSDIVEETQSYEETVSRIIKLHNII